jgi:hypothetical protein
MACAEVSAIIGEDTFKTQAGLINRKFKGH